MYKTPPPKGSGQTFGQKVFIYIWRQADSYVPLTSRKPSLHYMASRPMARLPFRSVYGLLACHCTSGPLAGALPQTPPGASPLDPRLVTKNITVLGPLRKFRILSPQAYSAALRLTAFVAQSTKIFLKAQVSY